MQSGYRICWVRILGTGIAQEKIAVTGSVKYRRAFLAKEEQLADEPRRLAERLGLTTRDVVWVATARHAPEEQIVLDAVHSTAHHPSRSCVCCSCRAGPDRFDEVASVLINRTQRRSFVRRSQLTELPAESPSVILIDTMGELVPPMGPG